MSEKRLRLAIVSTHPPGTGSLNEYAYHFIRFLRFEPSIEEIILFTEELPAGEQYDFDEIGVPVKVVPCWRFNDSRNAWRIWQAIRAEKPDAVWMNVQFASFGDKKIAATLGMLLPSLLKISNIPTIVLLHNIMETVDLGNAGFGDNMLMQRIIRLAGNIVTRFILQADLVALTLPKYVDILTEKYKAENAILAPHGSFDDAPPPSYELSNGTVKIMTFGKLGTYKKVEPLVEAFEMLQNENNRPPMELIIAGGNSPNAPDYIETVQATYAHVPNIRYTGYVAEDEVPTLFQEAAVVAFPYTSTTGSSGVLHQAGDYGKAVVLPNIGDFAEVITEEGYTGEFFEPEDVNSIAQAITNIIDHPARRIEIGTQNYLASRGLPIARVADWYLLHFQNLIEQKSR